jgi:hypothetical protein
MDLTETIVAPGACALLLMVAVVLDRRPYRPGKLNYIPLMVILPGDVSGAGSPLVELILVGVNRGRVASAGIDAQGQNRRPSRSFS